MIEAMKQALEALEHLQPNALTSFYTIGDRDKAIKSLRQAIAEAEKQEPVDSDGSPCPEFWDWLPKAYRDGDIGDAPRFTKYNMEVAFLAGKQSTHPPKREPLTDEQIDGVIQKWARLEVIPEARLLLCRDFARAIEAAHGIKGEA